MEKEKEQIQLPDNAFTELKPGEEYKPIMSPGQTYPEVNMWSVTWGIIMAMLFSAAAAYLGLKVGQVFEAAIPIAIIAVGVSTATKRNKALGENVIIQSIGACSGAVVAGAIFTLPEPAVRIDTTAFHLYLKVDSTYQQARFKLMGDSLHLLNYTLKAEWRPGQEYVLNIDSAAVQGISGKVNKTFDLKFRINTAEAYGSLFLVVPDAPPMAVVQLLNTSEKLVKQAKVENGRVDFFYLTPNDYYVRLFVDRNENGKWDEGCYADDRQAEEVYYYPQKFSVRANWDIEQTWQVKALPLNEQKPRELIKQKEQEKKTPKSRNAERLRNKQG